MLTVWPDEDFLSPLQCTLRVTSLLQKEDWDALSYYWGSANDLEIVVVHGSDEGAPAPSCEVKVTKNLTSALRHLREKRTAASEPLEIWTDALCINQRDAEEKSHQVSIMRAIFQSSRSVLVWLGARDSDPAAERGLANLIAISDYLGVHAFHREPALHGDSWPTAQQTFEEREAREVFTSVCALMDLPYWRRGWVLQEACAYGVPVFFHLENRSCKLVSWRLLYDTVCEALEFAKRQEMFDALASMLPSMDICLPFTLAETLRVADMRSYPARLLPAYDQMLDMILMQRMWQTSDPRDCVFVLRGIHAMFRELQVHYSDDVEEIFSDATTILLHNGGTWSRVCWSHPSESAYLPSWVVDFSSSCIHMSMSTQLREKSFLEGAGFNASASSILRVQTPAPQMLSTAGFVFDEIVDITRCLTHLESISDFDDSRWVEWLKFAIKHEHLLRNPVSLLRTVCAGMAPKGKAFQPNDIHLFWDSPIAGLWDLERPGRPGSEEETEAIEAWTRSVCAFMLQKRFFVTKSGRPGLAHKSAAVGDSIAIFASGDIPFVLRRTHSDVREEAYNLIGGCYLDGKPLCKKEPRMLERIGRLTEVIRCHVRRCRVRRRKACSRKETKRSS